MVKDTDQYNVAKSLILLIDNWQFGHLVATQQLKLQHWPGIVRWMHAADIWRFNAHSIRNLHH